jgi:hypothetical protein
MSDDDTFNPGDGGIDDPDDVSEALDGDTLGEQPGDRDLPGSDYPPERPLGVEDPTGSAAEDDVATRDWRTEDELDGIPDVPESGDAAAEEAAIHLTDEP